MEDPTIIRMVCNEYHCDKSIAEAIIECRKRSGTLDSFEQAIKNKVTGEIRNE